MLRLIELFTSDLRPAKCLLIAAAGITCHALVYAEMTHTNVELNVLLRVLSLNVWVALLFTYITLRTINVFQRVRMWVVVASTMIGSWTWGLLLIAGTTLPVRTGIPELYGVMILAELWITTQELFWRLNRAS